MMPRIIMIQECTDCPFCKATRSPNGTGETEYQCSKKEMTVQPETIPNDCPLETLAPDTWNRFAKAAYDKEIVLERDKFNDKMAEMTKLGAKMRRRLERIDEVESRIKEFEKKLKAKDPVLKSPGGNVLDVVMRRQGK